MTSRRRLSILGFVLLGIVVALVAEHWPSESHRDAPPATLEAPTESSLRAPRGRVASGDAQPDGPPSDGRSTVAPLEESSTHEPDGAALFRGVHVEVRMADGSWPTGTKGEAYLLAARDPGVDGALTSARLGTDGSCTLWLPRSGRFDVGVAVPDLGLWRVVEDVDARTTESLRITLPAGASIEVLDDTALGANCRRSAVVMPDDERPLTSTPGRESFLSRPLFPQLGQSTRCTIPVVAGMRVRVAVISLDALTTCQPDLVAAPAAVHVSRGVFGTCRLRIAVTPADRVARHDVRLDATFTVSQDGVARNWRGWQCEVAEGSVVRGGAEDVTGPVPAGRVTVAWHGAGIESSSVDFDMADGETRDVPVTLRLDAAQRLPGEDDAIVCVDGPADASDACCLLPDVTLKYGRPTDVGVPRIGEDFVVPVRGTRIAARARGMVAEPVALAPDRRHALVLRPAGGLRVLRGVAPPEGVRLVLRRADGGPLANPESDATRPWPIEDCVPLDDAEIPVGPLPEGDVELIVSYAGVDLARVTATVLAGKWSVVHLPLNGPLADR